MDVPGISSFVIRFVVEECALSGGALSGGALSGSNIPDGSATGDTRPVYRGEIRHIQSNEEIHFSLWSEAVAFIQRFVPIE